MPEIEEIDPEMEALAQVIAQAESDEDVEAPTSGVAAHRVEWLTPPTG